MNARLVETARETDDRRGGTSPGRDYHLDNIYYIIILLIVILIVIMVTLSADYLEIWKITMRHLSLDN